MTLLKWYHAHPRKARKQLLDTFADIHGVSVVTAASWVHQYNGRRHPASHKAWLLTEEFTGGQVTRFDELPDVYGHEKCREAA